MNDKLQRTMHEEDPFLSTEEEDLPGSAEEQDLFLPEEEQDVSSSAKEVEEQDLFLPEEEQDVSSSAEEQEFAPAPVSRPSKTKDRPSRPPSVKGQPSPLPQVKGGLSRKRLVGAGVAGLLVLAVLLGIVTQAFGSGATQTKSRQEPTSTPISQAVTPTPKLRATVTVVPNSLADGALILLNPGVVRQGSQMSVTGTGFPAKATIDLSLKRQAQDQSLASAVVQADKSGSFGGASLQVPTSLASGSFLVQASVRGSQQMAEAVGTIAGGTPSVKLSAQVAQPGQMIVVSLHGFSPSETVNVYWNSMGGQPVATLRADSGGGVGQASVQVPFGAVGPNTFLFVGSTSQALAASTIELLALYPTVTLSSYAIQADNAMSFTGKGFGPSERVLVFLNTAGNAPLAVLQADAKGAFSKAGSVLIPFGLKGKQTFVFEGEQSRTPTSVSFTVEPYTPSVQPSTYGGFPGTTVSFYATGFARNEVVHVYAGATQYSAGTLVSCFLTDGKGNAGAAGSYVIPGNASGKLSFKLIGAKSGGTAIATMSVAAPPSPVQVPPQAPFTCPFDTTASPTPSAGA